MTEQHRSLLPTLVGFPLGLLPNEASELRPFDLAHACLLGPASVEELPVDVEMTDC